VTIAVIGAGALGSALGALLWRAGEDVVLVGRAAHVAAMRSAGLNVGGVRGGFNATPRAEQRLSVRPALAILAVQTQDVVAALSENAAWLREVPVVVVQNGPRAEELAASVVPAGQLVSAVVALHAEYLMPGHVVLLESEGLLLGRPDGRNDAVVEWICGILSKALPTAITSNIRGARWAKLVVSLPLVLPAVTDLGFRQLYRERFLRRVGVGLMREGVAVAERSGLRLEPLPGASVPLARLVTLLPFALAGSPAARKAARLQTRPETKCSAWHSLARVRPTEVDHLNGEIVRRGAELAVPTPLNEAAVALVRRVAGERRHLTVHETRLAFERASPPRCIVPGSRDGV